MHFFEEMTTKFINAVVSLRTAFSLLMIGVIFVLLYMYGYDYALERNVPEQALIWLFTVLSFGLGTVVTFIVIWLCDLVKSAAIFIAKRFMWLFNYKKRQREKQNHERRIADFLYQIESDSRDLVFCLYIIPQPIRLGSVSYRQLSSANLIEQGPMHSSSVAQFHLRSEMKPFIKRFLLGYFAPLTDKLVGLEESPVIKEFLNYFDEDCTEDIATVEGFTSSRELLAGKDGIRYITYGPNQFEIELHPVICLIFEEETGRRLNEKARVSFPTDVEV